VAVLRCDVEWGVFKLLALLVGQLAFADEDPYLIKVPIAARSPDFYTVTTNTYIRKPF
jgi:hypothetical protein